MLRIRQRATASPNLLRALALKTNAVAHVAQLEGRDALELMRAVAPGAVTLSAEKVSRCS